MRLAATVMLVRDKTSGIEVFMLRRSARSPFAPDAFVFPGGAVDPTDYESDIASWDPAQIVAQFRASVPSALPTDELPVASADAHALVRAAVREVREEASIALDPQNMVLFSHWITPPTEPRRYNTHFFLAVAPADALGVADAYETHDARWISPDDALEQNKAGMLHLVYPTIKHLERLRHFTSASALFTFATKKPVITIMPDRAPHEGFVMPDILEGTW